MSYKPTFLGIDSIGHPLIINELENNYKSFLEWGFLNIGAFTNVRRPTQNISSFDLHILKPTSDPNEDPRTVWQAPRKDWVYDSGISYSGAVPISISGVYVNSTLYPAPTGNTSLGYKINYPEGKILFSKPLASTSNVQLEYSYRNIQVYKLEEFPYWKQIQHNSLDNKIGFNLSDRGEFSIGSEHRIQLPAIIIETIARSNMKPFQLGDTSQFVEQDILLHIISDQPKDKNDIVDIIRLQKDRIIVLYNTKSVVENNINPLNYDGSKNINGQNYAYIVHTDQYKWAECRISDINISDIYFDNIRLYGAIIRITNELVILQEPSSFCI